MQRTTGRGRREGEAIGSLYRGTGRSAEGGRSFPVIGVAGEYLLGPIKLLQQEDSSEQMRPSHGTQRECEVSAPHHWLRQAVCAPDHECERLGALGAPALQAL